MEVTRKIWITITSKRIGKQILKVDFSFFLVFSKANTIIKANIVKTKSTMELREDLPKDLQQWSSNGNLMIEKLRKMDHIVQYTGSR